MNLIQIYNMIDKLREEQASAMTEQRIEDAQRIQGQIEVYETMARDKANDSVAKPVASKPVNFIEQVFGAKAEFKGVEAGFEGKGKMFNAVTGLSNPEETDTELLPAIAKPAGFLGTLAIAETNADETYYIEPAFTNNAAAWASGNKPESVLAYTPAVALLETIAHWVPIKKQMANRYDTLQDVVEDSLLIGLDMKNDYYALRGDSETGITGIFEFDGVQEYEYTSTQKSAGVNLKDVFSRMATKVRVNSGLPATHVALSPAAIENIREAKDENGQYLFPDFDRTGTIAGLIVVEDANLQLVTTSQGSTTVTEQAVVYNNTCAKRKVADDAEVTIGVTGSQFIQNEYTVLAENTWSLKVQRPLGFCICEDLLITDSESFL